MRDIKYAVRRLLHNPGFSLDRRHDARARHRREHGDLLVVNSVLLRPLPYDEPERLVTMDHFYANLDGLEAGFAVPTYRDIRERHDDLRRVLRAARDGTPT